MAKESIKSKIARELCAKFPNSPHRSIASKLYKENVAVYKDYEDARFFIRKVRGKSGKIKSKNTETFDEGPRPVNPFNLPPSEEVPYLPFIIKGHRKILVLADIHAPYHNVEALSVAIQFGIDNGCDAVFIDGDLIDFYQLSRFDKDPRKRSVSFELEATRQVLAVLQKQLKCKIYFKLGNHDERYENYLKVKAPELLDITEFRLEELLKCREYDVTVITDKRVVKMNKLNAIHGHEYPGVFSPVNVARGLYMKGKVSAIQGHNHQTSEHTEPNMDGDITTTWSLGCLCELNPRYMPLNKWNHGFAFVELDENGRDYTVYNKRIKNGRVL